MARGGKVSLTVPNVGESCFIEWLRDRIVFYTVVFHLYQNNYVPVDTSVAANFTEATFPSYQSLVTSTAWQAMASPDNRAWISHPTITWTCTGAASGNTIY